VATKITREILESHLKCRYKGHLKLAGEQGIKSEYEVLLVEAREELQARAIEKLTGRYGAGEVQRGSTLSRHLLGRGAALILDGTFDDGPMSLLFDGLKRTKGPCRLGDFHYVPILYYEGGIVRQEQRLLLAVFGLLLASCQGRQPTSGIVVCGEECKLTKVLLSPRLNSKAQRILEEVRQAQASSVTPRLMLNEHCKMCEFRRRCHAQAEKEDDIGLLQGVGEKEITRYNRKGIFTLTQLSCTFRPRRWGKRVKTTSYAHYAALQALAIREKKIYVYGSPSLPEKAVRVFLDVEGNPERSFAYLVGMLICQQGSEQRRYSFWADSPEQESRMFGEFLDVLGQYEDFSLFHYGSYEKAFLRRVRRQAGRKKLADRILANSTNVLSVIHAGVYFPTLSNGLKEVGAYLGCTWTEEGASGLLSLVWRRRWEETADDAWKEKLLTYNQEDCAALKTLTEAVFTIIEAGKRRGEEGEKPEGTLPLGWAEDFRLHFNRRDWRTASFLLPDFQHINKCAYFDYQREKVFLRSSAAIKRACIVARRRRRKRLRPNRRIEIRAMKCPHCKDTDIVRYRDHMHIKPAYDLRITAGGIRRQVVHCVAALHKCRGCYKFFLPERYKRRDKHFHALKCWAMYQHVVHRVSLQNLVVMFDEFFGIRVNVQELHMIKCLMGRRYRATWKELLGRIASGNLAHVDETLVHLTKGRGYVWTFTNLEEVAYAFRPSREGDFLQELLAGFSGVLVSDFFSAYDSLPCKQQKCLVHLLRDFNSDLQSNPYDDEFKTLASEFGRLLRTIIATVDRYGLKRRHLHKHRVDVDRFYRALTSRQYRSELAASYQKRLIKNEDKLFTFLDHDGVPWNNNNAEHAIKRFAYYRRVADGMVNEKCLSDYLVLLSIYMTCKFKGVSFLRFLLSKEKDVDKFCRERPKPPKHSPLEVYPKGFPRSYSPKPPRIAPRQELADANLPPATELDSLAKSIEPSPPSPAGNPCTPPTVPAE
jgi:predicted RecB family nuclease